MPEGHELHRFAREHAESFAGKRLSVEAPNGRFSDGAAMLDGRKLRSVDAFGKHLFYDFGRELQLHIHLGMYGWFWDGPMPPPEPKGALRLRISSKTRWIELRGPTACEVLGDAERQAILARLGPDPLNQSVDPQPALEKIARSKAPIGLLLMDQSVIAGIGNCYRSELLFRAGVNPSRPGREVDPATVSSIWRDARKLMLDGMSDGRMVTTRPNDRPHKTGLARDGETHYVYRRAKQECFVCGTPIQAGVMASRNVFWCPRCQSGSTK